ncbi:MAG: hypothetical protein K6G26_13180, partial [Lachnospiraceae bacterium]|nr:hypothetical protein [Lachnospiraceae bacterium]
MNNSIKDRIIRLAVFVFAILGFCTVTNYKPAFAEPAPKIVIDSYSIKEGRAASDETFTCNFKVKNMSSTTDAYDVLITFNSENNYIYPTAGKTNQLYISSIGKGGEANATFEMKVAPDVPNDSVIVNFNIVCLYGADGTYNENNLVTAMKLEPSCNLDIIPSLYALSDTASDIISRL